MGDSIEWYKTNGAIPVDSWGMEAGWSEGDLHLIFGP